MASYRFTLAPGNEYGSGFTFAIVRSHTGGVRSISSDKLTAVTIQDGTEFVTSDPVTIAGMDGYVGVDRIGRGVTVQKGRSGTRTVDYDAATDADRTRESQAAVTAPAGRTQQP